MKRAEIRKAVNAHLDALGYAGGSWLWNGAELIVVIDGKLMNLRMRSGIAKRELLFNLGIIKGWAQIAGIRPAPKPKAGQMNGHKVSRHPGGLRGGEVGTPIHA